MVSEEGYKMEKFKLYELQRMTKAELILLITSLYKETDAKATIPGKGIHMSGAPASSVKYYNEQMEKLEKARRGETE